MTLTFRSASLKDLLGNTMKNGNNFIFISSQNSSQILIFDLLNWFMNSKLVFTIHVIKFYEKIFINEEVITFLHQSREYVSRSNILIQFFRYFSIS